MIGTPPPIPNANPVRWSPDLAEQVVSTPSPLTPGAPDYTWDGPYTPLFYTNANLYRRDAGGSFTLLSGTEAEIPEADRAAYYARAMGSSEDLRKVVFSANAGLEGAPSPSDAPLGNLYFTTDGRDIENIGILPDGTPSATGSTLAGEPRQSISPLTTPGSTAVSKDASRVFFATDAESPGAPQLYLRENPGTPSARTILISRSERSSPDAPSPVTFLAASEDGGKVLFSTKSRLTDNAGTPADPNSSATGDIYLYDVAADQLTDLTPGNPENLGVMGAADDLSAFYVVSQDSLAPGGAGQSNVEAGLFYWSASGFKFVATVGTGELGADAVLASRDGSVLSFQSFQRLTGYDNTDSQSGTPQRMEYVYDARRDTIACASCRPDGKPPAASVLPRRLAAPVSPGKPRGLSADGRRVIFTTVDSLTPGSATSRAKVYVFDREDNTVQLVSSGSSDEDDTFMDASADGTSIFFVSQQQLVSEDEDDLDDIYVSRVGGGFPAAPTAEQPCTGDTCQGPRREDPAVLNSGSTAGGPGNANPKPERSSRAKAATARVTAPKEAKGARVSIRVRVSGRGTLSASGAGLQRVKRSTTRSATYTLNVRLSSRAARTLQRRGRLTAKARVVFAPRGGKAIRRTVTLRFVREPAGTRAGAQTTAFEKTAG
jgi:hypothetical protein